MNINKEAFLKQLSDNEKVEKKVSVPIPFHGYKPAKVELQKEDSTDREIFLLKAQGFTNKRIAEQLGLSTAKVSMTVRQPWFMANMVKYLHEKGDKEVEKLLEIVSKDAIQVAYDVMMDETTKPALRAQTALDFIKASRGSKVVVENVTPDLKKLQEEEAALKEQLEELQHASGAFRN